MTPSPLPRATPGAWTLPQVVGRWPILPKRRVLAGLALATLVVGALPGDPMAEALAGKYRGTLVRVAGPRPPVSLPSFLGDFTAKTGIVVRFEALDDFEVVLARRLDAGLPPDIAEVRRPGLAEALAKKGRVVDLGKVLDLGTIQAQLPTPWVDLATLSGPGGRLFAGVWGRVNLQALVWYPRQAFEQAGYSVPNTWAELLRLQDRMKRDGVAPWALGLGDQDETGTSASAWVEALLLRVASPAVYDRWVRGQLKSPFPEVRKAVQGSTDLWFSPGNVLGDRNTVFATGAGEASEALFSQPPRAWLFLAGGPVTGRFPQPLVPGVDYDAFPLPAVDPRYGRPLLVTASLYTMLVDRPEVRACLQYLATAESTQAWVQAGEGFSPLRDVAAEWYPDPVSRRLAGSLGQATVVRWAEPESSPWKVALRRELVGVVAGSQTLEGALKASSISAGR